MSARRARVSDYRGRTTARAMRLRKVLPVLVPITRIERCDYPALWFLTDDIVARLGG